VLICLTTSGKSKNVKRAGRSESAPTENDRAPWLQRRINHRNGGRRFLIRSIEPPESWKRTQLLLYVLCEGEM
jgi:hypothetical protein